MSKMTIAFEIEDKDISFHEAIAYIESMANNEAVEGVKVYAAQHGCLFDKMERIENVFLNETPHGEVADTIEKIIHD